MRDPGLYGNGHPIIGANSVEFSPADSVYINSSGFLDIATSGGSGSAILGYALDNATMSSTNQTVAKVCPQYVYADLVEVKYPGDGAYTHTMVGEYTFFTSTTTNAQTVTSTTQGGTGQFLIVGFDYDAAGATTEFILKVAKNQSRSGSSTP